MLDVGRPRAGETVVVSGAAGATGSVAGQIARIEGCRVIGIAGGPEKCGWLSSEARFDATIDYKSEDVRERLAALCPDGVHVYFDNVGGPLLDELLRRIARGARIVLSGAISGYNLEKPPPGPRNYLVLIGRSARMEGFLVFDYASRFEEARRVNCYCRTFNRDQIVAEGNDSRILTAGTTTESQICCSIVVDEGARVKQPHHVRVQRVTLADQRAT